MSAISVSAIDDVPAPPFQPAAEPEARGERREQVDVDDRHQVDGVPVPVERAEQARAIRRRQIHQHVEEHADDRDERERSEGRMGRRPVAVEQAAACPDDAGDKRAEPDDAERSVRRPPVPLQIAERAVDRRDDVDVGRVGREDQRGGRAAAGAAERRPRQRRAEECVRQVVHFIVGSVSQPGRAAS